MDEGAGNLRMGIPRAYFYELDAEVRAAVEKALAVIGSWAGQRPTNLVAKIKEVHLEVPTGPTVRAAETDAYHAENVAKSPELYQPETLERIRSGEQYSAAEYIQRRREMEEQRRRVREIFAEVDVLVTPTTPITAPPIAGLKEDPGAMRSAELLLLRNTLPFNVFGIAGDFRSLRLHEKRPAYWLADRRTHWQEDLVLWLAQAFEQATYWHRQSAELDVT